LTLSRPAGALAALAVVVALLVVSLVGARRWGALAVLVAVPAGVGGGVGIAMTVPSYHYRTDAVGGFCLGVAVVLAMAVLLDRWTARGREPVPQVGSPGKAGSPGNTARPACD